MKSFATRRWIRSLIQSWFSQPARLTRKARILYRLQVEPLEDRVVPTTWTVLNANPTGAGSLFAAVSSANSDTSPALINFDPSFFSIPRTITLPASLTLSNTSEPITIQGPTNVTVTISGNNDLTDVVVNSGVTAFLQNLTFTQGNANGGNGGAVDMVGGTLSINNCTISSSVGSWGGGIYVGAGNLILQNSLITNNSNPSSAPSGGNGGGLAVVGGTATVLTCLFTNNASYVNFGGGDGGAIYAGGASMTIMDSTFTGNSDNTGEYDYYGGAIDASSPTTIINSTITSNSGANGGGGIYNNQTTVSLVNDIVWNNTGSQGANFASTNGSYTISYSLLGNANGANSVTYGPGDILNVPTSSSILGSLANNGGPTQTIALVPNSLPVGAAGNVAQLSSAISSSVTSFAVSSAAVFGAGVLPTLASGSYYTIEIGSEQMAVIGVSSSTLTVVRGINGTSAATHSSGASVYLVSDQRSFVVPPNNPPVVDMGAYQTTGLAPLPTVTSINPISGPTAGGTTVVIAGSSFTGTTAVKFGATNATTFTVNSFAQITATAPAGTGVVDVTVVTASGTSATSSSDQFTYVAPPTVTGLNPNAGPVSGGTSVVITGTGFTGATAVSFGGTPAINFTINSPTQITATSPAGAGVVDVTVVTVGGTSAVSSADQFTYEGAAVAGVSPNTGPVAGGTVVTITGSGFTGTTAVDFGVINATTYTVNSDTQITATSPPGTGVVDVIVTTPVGGRSATSSADQFTYGPTVTGLSPTSGPVAGGTSVTITGIGFTGATAVKFGATTATSFTVVSGTQITAISPAGAGVVDVTVTTPLGGTSATSAADQFTFVAAPTVTGLNPTAGPVGGGTSVTITGTGFTGATAVKFGAINATSFTVVSSTQITAVDPAGSGVVDVTVTTSGGTSATSSSDQFTYVVAPTVTSLSPTFGPVSGGTSVIITGTGFAGATAVSFGGTAATSFTVNSATQITAIAPADPLGTIDVTVTTLGGTSATSTSDHFAYVGTGSILVTTASDAVSHTGTSLRDAIASANSDAAAGQFDTITFASSLSGQTITLIQGALVLSGAGVGTISIIGSGNITISGNNEYQMLTVASGVNAVVTGLSLVNSYTTSSDVGGAVHNSGTLTVNNCSFTGNNATGSSSAISNAGVATVNDCFISGNTHGAVGNFATMVLVDSTLSGNYSATTIAGSLYTTSSSYTTLIGDTISNNYANGGGGLTNSGTMTILDSTVADNSAVAGNNGGGMIAYSGTLNIVNTTVTGNICGGNGGGIYVSGGSVTLLNSIVSGNSTSGSAPDFSQGGGTLTINHTLIGNTAGSGITSSSGTGNILNPTNSGLGTFGNYGGPTQTIPLLSGSPALGVAVSPSTASAVTMTANTVTVASGLLFAASSLPTLPQLSFTTQPTTTSEGTTLSPAISLQDLAAGAYFYIQIDGEEMAVTGLTLSGSTATLTVVRGANNTTASSHAANASVYLVSDQRGQVASFNNPALVDLGAYQSTASSPAALNSNSIAGTTVTLAISAGVLNGTLTATTDSSGLATFSDLSVPYAGTYTLEATLTGVPDVSSIPFTITEPASAPTVTLVSPNSGSTSGGTTVVITGANFTSATAVSFGATAATSFTVNSDTQITAVAPAEPAATVYVFVTNPSGNSEFAANAQFTYVMPPASVVVTTASDAVSHTGVSLRDAIGTANADAAAGESAIITFASSLNGQTITLTQGTLTLTGSGAGTITIAGNNQISVSGNNQYRDFSVASGVNAVFSGLTIENGWLSSTYGSGINNAGNASLLNCTISYNGGSTSDIWADGVFSTGTMTITNCTVSNNGVGAGTGGVYNYGGTMTVSNTTISSNLSAGLSNTGTIWVYNSDLTGNSSSTTSAGGFGNTGTAILVNVTISDNTATSNAGILNVNNGVVTVVDCAISGNYGNGGAGGVHNENGCMMTIIDSTIAGNMAPGNQGGGIINDGTMTVTNTTVVGNSAPTAAGIYNDGSLALFDTIVAANVGGGSDISGAVSGKNNLIGNGTGMSGISNGTNGNQVGTAANPINPLLNPLGNNGGPTQTMSEQTGSPAIGTGGAVTTLGAALSNATSTSITIPNYAIFASQALPALATGWYFIIQIDGEQMAVTGLTPASGTTGTLTAVRGINGTTAATHSSGANVYLVSDQRAFVVPSNNPPAVDIGAYQSSGSALLPTVTSISPNNGPATGGTTILITGANFTSATAVRFGGAAALSFTVNSDSQITAIDPAGSGMVDVTVVTGQGTSATSNADQFTYNASTTTSLSSNPVGPITQGTSITFTATISGNPSVGAVSFYYDYGAADQLQIGGSVNVSYGSATSDATTALLAGSDTITAIYSGGPGFQGSTGTLTIQVTAPLLSITSVVINQDLPALYFAAGQPAPGAQRSMVEDIVYSFSEPVNIDPTDANVFTIAATPGWTGTVPTLSWAPLAGSVDTDWAVTFSGAGVTGGSIANGAYTITLTDPSAITAVSDGQALSLASNGIGSATQSFYRLYGDISGDEVVNAVDNLKFKQGLTTYNAAFDINQDGFVNAYDSSYFKQDLGLNFSGFTATI